MLLASKSTSETSSPTKQQPNAPTPNTVHRTVSFATRPPVAGCWRNARWEGAWFVRPRRECGGVDVVLAMQIELVVVAAEALRHGLIE